MSLHLAHDRAAALQAVLAVLPADPRAVDEPARRLSRAPARGSFAVPVLLDALCALVYDCRSVAEAALDGADRQRWASLLDFVCRFSRTVSHLEQLRVNASDFDPIRILARGAYGQVSLVQCKLNSKTYALKKQSKFEVSRHREVPSFTPRSWNSRRGAGGCENEKRRHADSLHPPTLSHPESSQSVFFMEERNVLATLSEAGCEWTTHLFAAFQDNDFIYLAMEFVPGGDLLSHLMRLEQGKLDESAARFYLAEIVQAIEEMHCRNFVHRCVPQTSAVFSPSVSRNFFHPAAAKF
jgi:hypothetical protein